MVNAEKHMPEVDQKHSLVIFTSVNGIIVCVLILFIQPATVVTCSLSSSTVSNLYLLV